MIATAFKPTAVIVKAIVVYVYMCVRAERRPSLSPAHNPAPFDGSIDGSNDR